MGVRMAAARMVFAQGAAGPRGRPPGPAAPHLAAGLRLGFAPLRRLHLAVRLNVQRAGGGVKLDRRHQAHLRSVRQRRGPPPVGGRAGAPRRYSLPQPQRAALAPALAPAMAALPQLARTRETWWFRSSVRISSTAASPAASLPRR